MHERRQRGRRSGHPLRAWGQARHAGLSPGGQGARAPRRPGISSRFSANWAAIALATLSFWSLAAGAHAQVSAADKAAAEALFDRGLALLREGKLEEACSRLEQSQAIERGIGTMLYLAECYEKSGKTASAWALFREASSEAQAAGQSERALAGRQRAERLEPQLSRLTIDVPEAHRVRGLEVLRNGTDLNEGAWGVPVPVDPGEQHIEARAPGHLPFKQTVVVERGPGAWQLSIPQLAAAPVAAVPAPPAEATASANAAGPREPANLPPTAASPPERGLSTQRLVGLIVGGTGAALAIVGAGFGIRAIRKKHEANCYGATKMCLTQGDEDANQAGIRAAKVSTVGLAVGGAMLVGGLITYFFAPEHKTKVALSIDRRSAGLTLGGVF